jgi:hypothetical protein
VVACRLMNVTVRHTGYSLTIEEISEYERALRADSPKSNDSSSLGHAAALVAQPTTDISETSANEPRVLTFAELKELIQQGKTDQIPNNRIVPEGLNVGALFSSPWSLFTCWLLGCTSKRIGRTCEEETLGKQLIYEGADYPRYGKASIHVKGRDRAISL